jgi:restriction endonuclease Mrr
MAKISKPVVDATLRLDAFQFAFPEYFDIDNADVSADKVIRFDKVNDRQFGLIMKDLNGNERYIRIGAIVAEEREDMTAQELMQKEIDDYNAKKADKAEKAKAKAVKIAKDKAKREQAKAEDKDDENQSLPMK